MKNIMVEVDLFVPKGTTPKDWDFISTLRLQIDPDNVKADSENVALAIEKSIKEWKAK